MTKTPREAARGRENDLRREFATLALLRHPNLVEVHDLDVAPGTGLPRFTLEFIDGDDFVTTARREGPSALLSLSAEVLRALAFLHDFGLVHRDLKPGNVLVRGKPRLGCRAVVLDFGLALRGGAGEEEEEAPGSGGAAGTLPYLAPELFEGERADRRSDLYALGALVYEGAHGSPAFRIDGRDLTRFIEAVREGRRARPPLPEGYPPGLADWLEELLSPDPASRPADALEALARLNATCGTQFPTDIPATRAARLGSGEPVGRERELDELWRHLEKADTPRVVWLCGGAGSGKSRVLRYLSGNAVARGWDVIAPPPGNEVGEGAGGRGSVEEDVASRLANLRERAGANSTLLLVDQVESAPDRTIRLVERIARERGGAPVRVVLAVRPAELTHRGAKKLLDDTSIVPTLRRVDLEPMDNASLRAMAARATGSTSVSESRVKWLSQNSEGVPLVAESLLVEGAWEQRGRRKTHVSLSESVALRLAMLSEDGVEWLRALCVLGEDSRGTTVGRLAGLDGTAMQAAAEEVSASGLARERSGRWSPDSRLVSEQVLANVSARRQAELYKRAAESLIAIERKSRKSPDPWRLARLWAGAGDGERAVEQAFRAAEASLARKDHVEAAERFGFALRQLSRQDKRRRELRMRQGTAYLDAENYEPAIRAFGSAVRLSGSRPERADALGRQAHALALSGRFKRAEAVADDAIAIAGNLGLQLEEARAKRILGIVRARMGMYVEAHELFEEVLPIFESADDRLAVAETLHGIAALSRAIGMNPKQPAERAAEIFRTMGLHAKELKAQITLTQLRSNEDGIDDAIRLLEEIRNRADKYGFAAITEFALARQCFLAEVRGCFDEAVALADEALDHARHLGNVDRIAELQGSLAESLTSVGRPNEAIRTAREVLDLPRRDLSRSASDMARVLLADALLEQDGPENPEARELLNEAIASLRQQQAKRILLVALASEMLRRASSRSEDPFEPVGTEYEAVASRNPRVIDVETRFRAGLATATYCLRQGRFEEALEVGFDALNYTLKAGFLAHAARVYVVLASTYERMGASLEASNALAEGRAVLDQAAERIKDEKARRDFLARRVFERLRRADEPGRTSDRQLGALYDMIAALNSETDPDALLESILDMALRVVEAERGMILLRDEKNGEFSVRLSRNLEEETASDAESFSRSIVSKAGAGESILALDAGNDDRFRDLKSVSLFKIRSLMCVPLKSRGKIVGTVYLDSRRKGKLFTKDDLGFVEAFANHAALALENARTRARLEAENRRLLEVAGERARFDNIVGRCAAMQKVFDLIETVATSELPVLIQGESGTGKELVARAIHFHGPRRRRIILSENCAAIPETLLESELFGHVRGAFTGAERDRPGLFEQADGGTLFLDEVGDMSAAMQARLLRVLQEGELRRVGGEETIDVDVRVIAATHEDLPTLVQEGRFREDLFYRLQVLAVQLPPLRERTGDIPLLVDHLMERISRERGRETPRLTAEVMALLEGYPWPGNVRQLENTLQRLALLAADGPITREVVEADDGLSRALLGDLAAREPVYSLERNEKEQIRRALEACGGNRNRAARMLGISRATIYRKIKEYDLS